MHPLITRRLSCIYSALAIGLMALPASAQPPFPGKPIRLIVPFAAGGSTDVVARIVAEQMGKQLGQPVVVDNRSGASGMIGTEAVALAAPDGYMMGIATVNTMTGNPVFYPKADKTRQQLRPLIMLVNAPAVLAVHPSFPAKDFAGFVAELKRRPGVYNKATAGSMGELALAVLNHELGIKIVGVPYRGMGAALTDGLAGTLQITSDTLPSLLPQLKSGRLVPIAVAGDKRLGELPQVPTFKEMGHGEIGDIFTTWIGLVVPKKTPDAAAERLRTAAHRALQSPEVTASLQELGASAATLDEQGSEKLIENQIARNRALVQRANIKVE